jgi:acyl carrier protein
MGVEALTSQSVDGLSHLPGGTDAPDDASYARTLDAVLDAAAHVFGRPVGAEDDFFKLGGDSVIAVEMMLLLGARLSKDVDEEAFFEAESFAALAAALAGPAA